MATRRINARVDQVIITSLAAELLETRAKLRRVEALREECRVDDKEYHGVSDQGWGSLHERSKIGNLLEEALK